MKKIYNLIASLLLISGMSFAQTDINFDASSTAGTGWIGFMNVSNRPAPCDDGVFQYPSGWGVSDLIALLDTGANTATLLPNRIGVQDDYWQQGPPGGPFNMLEGNKFMDANCYIEDDSLLNTPFTFNGEVLSNTLDDSGLCAKFTVEAFIKVFNADYSVLEQHITVPLNVGVFQLIKTVNGTPGGHVQYGFEFFGPNINNAAAFDAAYAALGGIVVTENSALSTDDLSLSSIKAYPNPTQNTWTINSRSDITDVRLYDVLGKEVLNMQPNSLEAMVDGNNLANGLYFAKVTAVSGSQTIRLVKE